jgi:hypothetical protein
MATRTTERMVTDLSERARDRMMASRMDRIDRENERLKGEVRALREDLAEERSALQRALDALSKRQTATVRKPRRFRLFRTAVIGGGAYLLGTRAGRERYDQIVSAMRSAKDSMQGRMQSSDAAASWEPGASSTPGSTTAGSTTAGSRTLGGNQGSATAAPSAG